MRNVSVITKLNGFAGDLTLTANGLTGDITIPATAAPTKVPRLSLTILLGSKVG